jgi:membrane protein YdbS with pleckstrin-like domain
MMHIRAIQFEEGEEVLHVARRHWFYIALVGFLDGALFFISIIGGLMLFGFMRSIEGVSSYDALAVSVYMVALFGLFLWMHFFAMWTDHWLDAWIVTNKRIIDIEQKGFFNRQVSSFPLNRIQDVTYDTVGIIAMWLHFGNVRLQTASISSDLVMKQVSFPKEIKELISSLLANSLRDVHEG